MDITMAVPKNEKCGISDVGARLAHHLDKIGVHVKRELFPSTWSDLLHIQHEFNIFPKIQIFESAADKRICTFHSCHFDKKEFYKKVSSYLDGAIVHMKSSQRRLSRIIDVPVYYIPHGAQIFDTVPLDRAKEEINMTGRIIGLVYGFAARRKRFEEIIRALPRVIEENSTFHLILTFSPHRDHSFDDYLMQLKSLAGDINVMNNVSFIHKYLPEDKIRKIALGSDVIISSWPSWNRDREGASASIKDILCAQRPVIVSESSGYRDLTHGVDCLKFQCYRELSRQINLVLSDEEISDRISKGARALALEHRWSNIAPTYKKIYRKMIE